MKSNTEEIDDEAKVKIINEYSRYFKKIDKNQVKFLGAGGEASVKSIKPLAPIDVVFKTNHS